MKKILPAIMLGALLVGGMANATTITYTDASSWDSAVTITGGDNFSGYNWSAGYGNDLGSSTSLSGVSYTNGNGEIFGLGTAVTYDAPYLQSGSSLEWQDGNTLTITLPTEVTALSFDFGQFYGDAGNEFDITLGNGFSTSVFTADNAYAFFGVVSDTAFSTLSVTSNPFPVIDDLAFGNAGSTVPEPGSIALLGIAFAGLMGVTRFRKHG